MTKLTKETIEEKAENLSDKAKSNISTLSKDIKASTNMAADNVVYKTEQTKDHAVNLVENIRQLVSDYTNPEKINAVKSEVTGKAKALKENVSNEVAIAVEKTTTKVQEKPISSVAIAAGVGALLGYVLASRKK